MIKGGNKFAKFVIEQLPAIERERNWELPIIDKAVWAMHIQENIQFNLLIQLLAFIYVSASQIKDGFLGTPNAMLRDVILKLIKACFKNNVVYKPI